MQKILLILTIIVSSIAVVSFVIRPADTNHELKKYYTDATSLFINECSTFKKILAQGNEKEIQQQFFKTRTAYKKVEIFAEYFFPFYAGKLNGPPIVFYEDEEADIGEQQPNGMQLIESLIFPELNKEEKELLDFQASELLRYAEEMIQVNESVSFDDNNISDAIIEQLYRITALGLSGFDSPVAMNSLEECRASLQGLQEIFSLYQKQMKEFTGDKFTAAGKNLGDAVAYLEKNRQFNSFNRVEFIRLYLNPVTVYVSEYKKAAGFTNNESLLYKTAIKKDNTLFAKGSFNPYRFLDDYSSSPEKVQLGKKLFFENQLSSTNKRSCASCHQPGKMAFTDGLATSVALDGHTALPRNAPTIWNAALQRKLFTDSRSNTLESQVMAVLSNAAEMNGSADAVAQKVLAMPEYSLLYKYAYPSATAEQAAENICNAIASYERTLIALNSRFDRHMRGENTLTPKEIRGFNLFMGKAKCGTCHFTPLFSGAKPPRFYEIESEIIGTPAKNVKKKARLDADSGRYNVTGLPMHLFAFKTPTLRNVALTAPYMHNGVFNTLEEVVDFYNNGGGQGLGIAPVNQTLPFDKLHLSKTEKKAIVSFMQSLTDTSSAY